MHCNYETFRRQFLFAAQISEKKIWPDIPATLTRRPSTSKNRAMTRAEEREACKQTRNGKLYKRVR